MGLFFHEVLLFENVHKDLHVVDVDAVDVLKTQVVHRAVSPEDTRDFRELHALIPEEMGSTVVVLLVPLSDPPIVSIALNSSLSLYVEMSRVSNRNKVQ